MGTSVLDARPVAARPVVASDDGPVWSAVSNIPDAGSSSRHRGLLFLRQPQFVITFSLFVLSLALYLGRLAPSVVPGDPGEYQLVAARWGIGHPPGYGFYAVVGNLFTHLFALGSFAWRANVFAAVCAAWMVALCYSMGRIILGSPSRQKEFGLTIVSHMRQELSAVLGALALAAGIGFWQHAIHANAHILTALLALLTLYCLVRWWHVHRLPGEGASEGRRHGWLYAAAFLAGVSPTQHPLLVFAFPAYVIFGLLVLWAVLPVRGTRHPALRSGRPSSMLRWPAWTGPDGLLRVLLGVVGFGLAGLSLYLYYPIRSAISVPPPPGPSDMNTWAGFVRVVTAQGLRGNLLGFTAGQILNRLWDVRVPLLMQFSVVGLAAAGLGWVRLSAWPRWPGRRVAAEGALPPRACRWQVALLFMAYLVCIILVTVNVLQDAVAYLLGPMAVIAALVGAGVDLVLAAVEQGVHACLRAWPEEKRRIAAAVTVIVAALLLAMSPLWALSVNWTRMDLSSFRDAEDWLAAVAERFVGQGQHAAVLAEWERMTTVYYVQAVEGREWSEGDLTFVPISAGTEAPFLDAAERLLTQGPVYLTTYRPEVATRYRLVPVPIGRSFASPEAGWSGTLWEVLPAWPRELPVEDGAAWAKGIVPVHILAYAPQDVQHARPLIEIVGWRLSPDAIQQGEVKPAVAQPGDVLALDLLMRWPPESTQGGAEAASGISPAFYLPWVRLGETTYQFTTDSRFNTPWWQPGEIVIERFELPVPWVLPDAEGSEGQLLLPLQVGMREVSQGRELTVTSAGATGETESSVSLTSVPVAAVEPDGRLVRDLDRALGNLRGEILMRSARINGRRVGAGRDERWALEPDQTLRVVLEWQSLRPIGDNYKVFVQLLDAGLQVQAQGDDKAPLGGSAPTVLWFPRWRAGTRITDTYLLDVPADLPPGTYPLIVGMYGFSTFKRLPVVSYDAGTGAYVVQGDWITLAHFHVE